MFNRDFFIGNRKRLADKLPNSFIVITAHGELQKSADEAFPFRQDSSFWYLTGIDEPELVLLINTVDGESELLLPEQNDYQKEWDGHNDETEFTNISGVKKFADKSKLTSKLKKAKEMGLKVCYLKPLAEKVQPFNFYSNPARRKLAEKIMEVEPEPKDIRLELGQLRQVKQQCEIEAIQRAIDITNQTLDDVKSRLEEFKTEKDIERALTAGFYANGGDGHAFSPIVAFGPNASTIHYNKNSSTIDGDGFVLLDIGARFDHYAADISRMLQVGEPTERQHEIYQVVADIQAYALKIVKPGITIQEINIKTDDYAVKLFKKHAIDMDCIPHSVSHYLGIDTHDAGDYDLPLEPGCVLTVEPGVYLPKEGIGVRIEDDVLVTETGVDILS